MIQSYGNLVYLCDVFLPANREITNTVTENKDKEDDDNALIVDRYHRTWMRYSLDSPLVHDP
jgi:hypothetical protein